MASRYIVRETPTGRPSVPRPDLGLHSSRKAAIAVAKTLPVDTEIVTVRRSA